MHNNTKNNSTDLHWRHKNQSRIKRVITVPPQERLACSSPSYTLHLRSISRLVHVNTPKKRRHLQLRHRKAAPVLPKEETEPEVWSKHLKTQHIGEHCTPREPNTLGMISDLPGTVLVPKDDHVAAARNASSKPTSATEAGYNCRERAGATDE